MRRCELTVPPANVCLRCRVKRRLFCEARGHERNKAMHPDTALPSGMGSVTVPPDQ